MSSNKQQIREWIERGVAHGCTHMLVVCDTFSHEDYPVYVTPDQICQIVYEDYNGQNMQAVVEIYDLQDDIEAQLQESRAWST